MSGDTVDVAVIGDGVIGLSIAFELGRAGAHCAVFGAASHGAASGAAAGLLAPSIGALRPGVRSFFDASLAFYPAFVEELRTFEPELVLLEGLWDLSSHPAVFHPRDGAIDNQLLVRALRRAVRAAPSCSVVDDPVVSIAHASEFTLRTRTGATARAKTLILAAGAWSPAILGLPRHLPVIPLKGQMLAVTSSALRHAVMGDDVYLVPRKTEIVIGATAEHSGFDTTVVPESIERLRAAAIQLCPSLADAPVARTWAGIRPATPDMLPILGPDPENGRLLYACGHSKNGILLAPATAKSLAEIAAGNRSTLDIGPFSIMRFPTAE